MSYSLVSVGLAALTLWSIMEVAFYVYFCRTRRRLQALTPPMHLSKEQRTETFKRIFNILTPETVRPFFSGWMFNAPFCDIYRGNMSEWLEWAFNLPRSTISKEEEAVLDAMVHAIEQHKLGHALLEGKNPAVRAAQHTLDPVHALHRPLVFYLFSKIVWLIAYIALRCFGFRRYHAGDVAYWYRPATTPKEPSMDSGTTQQQQPQQQPVGVSDFSPRLAADTSAFNKPEHHFNTPNNQSRTAPQQEQANEVLPLVFIHGIGIGLFTYLRFFWSFLSPSVQTLERLSSCAPCDQPHAPLKSLTSRALFLVELPHISMQFRECKLSLFQIVDALDLMLRQQAVTKAVWAGHSYGSIVVTWMAQRRPQLVSSAVLIDPVCFLLFLPDVCMNFVYRGPRSWCDPIDVILYYFAKRELFIAHTLARHFWWYNNEMWPEYMPDRTTVLLSGQDEIVPARAVRDYLLTHQKKLNDLRALQKHAGSSVQLTALDLEETERARDSDGESGTSTPDDSEAVDDEDSLSDSNEPHSNSYLTALRRRKEQLSRPRPRRHTPAHIVSHMASNGHTHTHAESTTQQGHYPLSASADILTPSARDVYSLSAVFATQDDASSSAAALYKRDTLLTKHREPKELNVIWCEKLRHAQFLLDPNASMEVLRALASH